MLILLDKQESYFLPGLKIVIVTITSTVNKVTTSFLVYIVVKSRSVVLATSMFNSFITFKNTRFIYYFKIKKSKHFENRQGKVLTCFNRRYTFSNKFICSFLFFYNTNFIFCTFDSLETR